MYRRRSFRPRPRRRFIRRTARPATQVGSGKWQWGNFFSSIVIQGPGAGVASSNVLFELASLEPNHFNDVSSAPANAALAVTQSNMIKAIDIGGIVIDMGCHWMDTTIEAENGLIPTRYHNMFQIILDKKDPSTGAPTSTNANYAVSTFPSNVVDFAAPRPTTGQEIRDYAARILYRSADYVNPGLQVQSTPDSELLASRVRQEVVNPQRHRSLRIKRRLTDDWGLYAGFSVWTPSAPDPSSFYFWISGSIYYRLVW